MITWSQRQALEDIEHCGDPWARVHGTAQTDGWHGVLRVLRRNGWATKTPRGRWELTEVGKQKLADARRREP